jgi:hypothetical protein
MSPLVVTARTRSGESGCVRRRDDAAESQSVLHGIGGNQLDTARQPLRQSRVLDLIGNATVPSARPQQEILSALPPAAVSSLR